MNYFSRLLQTCGKRYDAAAAEDDDGDEVKEVGALSPDIRLSLLLTHVIYFL